MNSSLRQYKSMNKFILINFNRYLNKMFNYVVFYNTQYPPTGINNMEEENLLGL